jgi:hypothetical protein
MPLAYIIINTNKNISNHLQIKFNAIINNRSNIGDNEHIIFTHDLVCTENDPEYSNYIINSNDIYIIDPYYNVIFKGHQPYGNYILQKDSKFYITSTIHTQIEITYCIFDILRCSNNNIMLSSNFFQEIINNQHENNNLDIIENVNIHGDIVNNEINDIDIDHVNALQFEEENVHEEIEENVHEEIEENIHEEIEENVNENNILNIELYSHLITKYEQQNAIRKKIYDNTECIISWQSIKYNDYYYECDQCKVIFDWIAFKKWFNIQHAEKSCPHCRKKMYHFPQLYKNCRDYFYYVNQIKIKLYNIYATYL